MILDSSACRVIIDSNNHHLVEKILYLFRKDQLITEHSEFILDTEYYRKSSISRMLLMVPLQPVSFKYDNHQITVKYKKSKESSHFQFTEFRYDQYMIESDHSFDHLCKFLNMLSEINISEEMDVVLSKYIWKPDAEDWIPNRKFKKRTLDSIYFHQKQKIIDTLDYFLNDSETQAKYDSLSIPYKKVFLFHGIPGTGKTSFIQALASHFNYHLSVVQTLLKIDDIALEQMVSSLRKKSFLVFEDIDTLLAQRETSKQTNITFGGLLNMLDGIGNYDKLVVFITTNVIQQLDPAFRRRVDMFVEFGYMQKNEILDMHQKFFDSTPDHALQFYQLVRSKKITANTLEKFFIHCLSQKIVPEQSLKQLDDYNTIVSEKSAGHLYM